MVIVVVGAVRADRDAQTINARQHQKPHGKHDQAHAPTQVLRQLWQQSEYRYTEQQTGTQRYEDADLSRG